MDIFTNDNHEYMSFIKDMYKLGSMLTTSILRGDDTDNVWDFSKSVLNLANNGLDYLNSIDETSDIRSLKVILTQISQYFDMFVCMYEAWTRIKDNSEICYVAMPKLRGSIKGFNQTEIMNLGKLIVIHRIAIMCGMSVEDIHVQLNVEIPIIPGEEDEFI